VRIIKGSGHNTIRTDQNNTIRTDGWINVLTHLGSNASRAENTRYGNFRALGQKELSSIYMSDSVGRRIVNMVVDDAMRGFIDCEKELLDELKRLKIKQHIIDTAILARVYGGALLVAFVDDGKEFYQPLDINNIKSAVTFKSFDRYQVSLDPLQRLEDVYLAPEWYRVQPLYGTSFDVHHSRCFIFGGERTPEHMKNNNGHWDYPILQILYEHLRNYGIINKSSIDIVQDFTQTILSVNSLTENLSAEGDNPVIERLKLLDLSRSTANTILLDADNEQYHKQSSSVAGLPELWDRFSETLSAATGIPISKLFGRSAKGLNANMDNDIGNWNDVVEAYRTDEIEPCINWIIEILENQKNWTTRPSTYEWEFPSLRVPSDEEWANIKYKIAQVDQIYMDRGAVDPKFLFEKRYANGEFKPDIYIDPKELHESNEAFAEEQALLEEIASVEASVKKEEVTRKDDEDESVIRTKLYSKILEAI
jgi:phage-related protein (TIGR01555 family)